MPEPPPTDGVLGLLSPRQRAAIATLLVNLLTILALAAAGWAVSRVIHPSWFDRAAELADDAALP